MSLPTKVGLGSLCALLAAILAIALWPASEADGFAGTVTADDGFHSTFETA